MAGIYIHIPFCKQACHYCDFHFSTSMKKKTEMIEALAKEIITRKEEFSEKIETIYFGGGTPSLLLVDEINFLIGTIYSNYKVDAKPEITLEANPDDLSSEKIKALAQTKINRLSIGVQSFFEDDLKLMNRAHNAKEALRCLDNATKYFSNISIDLIYGIQHMSVEKWKKNIHTALSFNIPHISSYALTVEPKTALAKFIKTGAMPDVDDELAQQHFEILVEMLEKKGFVHYELSNFGKEGYFSRNNTAYWLGKKYMGIGPSAHSFDGKNRSWNINNNTKYLNSIHNGVLPKETERLSVTDRYNEAVMTGLRTIWGISLHKIENKYGKPYKDYLLKQAARYIKEDLLTFTDNKQTLKTGKKGKFLADGIASDLFMLKDIA
ncbi:radical SAM family heme chaperone HemW [Galbibacter sp. PAP.153]|uniref:radical SAM family heme chaperone HemW n=1 Tax=Galbibacter sp. PAP.153 TaxID=3104623 RepID=UPI003009FD5A